MINSDKVVAWLRTAVPIGWGALVAFLLSRFPAVHDLLVNPAVTMVVTGLVVTGWYSLWKWLEPRIPAWMARFVLGYDVPPVYFTGALSDEVYKNGYQAGQDDAVAAGPRLHPDVLDRLKEDWHQARTADIPRSISRPGESSGPHALTDIMPTVPADEDESGEGAHRG